MAAGNWLRVQIRVKGQLDQDWSEWLDDLAVRHTGDGDTLLSGSVCDQAALYGLLARLSSLGLPLISVSSRTAGKEDGMKDKI
jgi:hypothetical protein